MNTVLARGVSLAMAVVMAGLITFYPPAVARMGHGMLTLVIWGVCAGFVHGFGYQPDSRIWRVLFAPLPAWLMMGAGLYGALRGMHG